MAIPSRQIGWGTEENLLWQISKQLESLTGVASTITGGTGSSGSSGTSGASGTSGSAGTAGLSGSSGSSGITGTSGLSGDRYKTTSTTSFTLGSGGTITVGTGLAYTPAQDVIISFDINNHQVSDVTTYNPTTGVLVFGAPTQLVGSGTYTNWVVNLNGAAGGDGSSGTSGSSGVAGTSGIAGTSGVTGTSGSSGTSGATGTNGSSGTSASSGTAGIAGTAGTSGLSPILYSGTFFDTTTQNNGGATTANQVLINSTQLANGFTLGPDNRINVTNAGVYFLNLSLQLTFTGGASNYSVTVWYTLNDVIVDNSAFTFTTTGAQNDQTLAVVTDTIGITAGQYLKFYWWSQATGMKLLPTAVGSNPTRPLSPSVNFTIFNIA
jgi:Collagen triple helix repeat (20 copies)